ncbi:MAG: diphthine synthase [Candidatus Micrarchaeia archaeon]
MGLYLIGLGINPPDSISFEAVSLCAGADSVFIETYTNILNPDAKEQIEKVIGRKVELIEREALEDERDLLDAATEGECCLLVPGDPMVATTHINLAITAKKHGLGFRIVHASSVTSAAASESGLQAYKFGAITTIPHFRQNYSPTASLDVIAGNQKMGLHTLCLLDIDKVLGPLTVRQACENVLSMGGRKGTSVFSKSSRIVVLSRLGYPDQQVSYSKVSDLLETPDSSFKPPCCVIIPGKLHFIEEEFLELVKR